MGRCGNQRTENKKWEEFLWLGYWHSFTELKGEVLNLFGCSKLLRCCAGRGELEQIPAELWPVGQGGSKFSPGNSLGFPSNPRGPFQCSQWGVWEAQPALSRAALFSKSWVVGVSCQGQLNPWILDKRARNIHWKKVNFLQMVQWKLDIYIQKS